MSRADRRAAVAARRRAEIRAERRTDREALRRQARHDLDLLGDSYAELFRTRARREALGRRAP